VEFYPAMTLSKQPRKSNPWKLRLGERRSLLIAGDFLMALITLVISLIYWGSSVRFIDFNRQFLIERVPAWFYFLPVVWVILLVELYDIHRAGNWRATVRGVAVAALIGFGLYLLLYFYYVDPPRSLLPRRGVASFLIIASLLTLAWRWIYIRIFTAPQFMRRVLLVGGGETGKSLLHVVNHLSPPPFYVVGVIDDDPGKTGLDIEGHPVIATSEQLLDVVDQQNVSDIMVAISGEMQGKMFQALLDAQQLGVEIIRMPKAYEELLLRVPIRFLEADWILRSFVDEARVNGFYELGKRLLDILGGLIGTLILVILLPFLALVIFLDDGAPIIYTQIRSGRGGQPYKIIKLRTMRRDAEADGTPQWAKEDDDRATRSGRFLRKTHLDELPQFLNVLRGEMSLVGPRAERPELVQMFQKHVPFYRARLLVKPGITGWAQINMGYASTIDETINKLEYDLYYIKHRNMIMDALILLRTPATVFGFRGR
jgi:exopolysaccharide biosynthesis polyprenyl glycosylphosphotransferase